MTAGLLEPADPAAHSRIQGGHVLRIEVARLQPFSVEPDSPLCFSDLQAAFGADVFAGRRIAAILGDAQLIRRVPPPQGGRPTYLCEKALIKLLAPRRRASLDRAGALRIACRALEEVTKWSGQGRAVRLVGFAFVGGLLDAKKATLDGIDVELTVRVKRARTLAQELQGLFGCLRGVVPESLRGSLVLELE